MNQKNIFTGIAVVLVLQGIVFFIMKDSLVTSAFPAITGDGHLALTQVIEVMSALSLIVGLIAYASRTTPSVVWAFAVGFAVMLAVTLKHLLVDNINVPIPAVAIQVLIVLLCGYLWLGKKGS